MLGDGVIGLFFAVGIATWSYNWLMKHTMNTKNSLIGAAVIGVIGYIVIYTLLKYMLHW